MKDYSVKQHYEMALDPLLETAPILFPLAPRLTFAEVLTGGSSRTMTEASSSEATSQPACLCCSCKSSSNRCRSPDSLGSSYLTKASSISLASSIMLTFAASDGGCFEEGTEDLGGDEGWWGDDAGFGFGFGFGFGSGIELGFGFGFGGLNSNCWKIPIRHNCVPSSRRYQRLA
ncbi:hypothetical protein K474DRAFT_703966 [Panus rudis PR-1116 ss-1]|nr:hypothetical protein K474DRAFT_703966 [Panus rudis PR-1116 ss-1]